MACIHITGCPFFNDKMPALSGVAAIYKKRYCAGEYEICARYKVAKVLGKEKVPGDLYPNQFDVVEKIIQDEFAKM